MRNGIIFGTDMGFENFAVVGDSCEGNIVCRWMTEEELSYEIRINGVNKCRTLDKVIPIGGSVINGSIDLKTRNHLLMLPVISTNDEELVVECTPIRQDNCVTVMAVKVYFSLKLESFSSKLPCAGCNIRSFEDIIVLDYSEDIKYEPYWKNIDNCIEVYDYLSNSSIVDEAYDNLKNFVKEFNVSSWATLAVSTPIMALLENKNIHACRNNSQNSLLFYKKYGAEESPVFRYPLLDHVVVFKTTDDSVLIASSPYLSDAEITQYMDCLVRESTVSGSYSNLKYTILGKEKHIYKNKQTNLVLFHL